MAIKCPHRNCTRKFTTQGFAESHADAEHPDWRIPKQKGWCTPYGFGDWNEPITYEDACELMKEISEKLIPQGATQ
jgi:hypothetical protein